MVFIKGAPDSVSDRIVNYFTIDNFYYSASLFFFEKYAKMHRNTFVDCPRHHFFACVVRTSNFSSGTHAIFTNKMVAKIGSREFW